jgi:hypothetical protein
VIEQKNYAWQKLGLFATPESSDALMKYVEQFSGSERVIAMTIMGMTYNLCCDIATGEK